MQAYSGPIKVNVYPENAGVASRTFVGQYVNIGRILLGQLHKGKNKVARRKQILPNGIKIDVRKYYSINEVNITIPIEQQEFILQFGGILSQPEYISNGSIIYPNTPIIKFNSQGLFNIGSYAQYQKYNYTGEYSHGTNIMDTLSFDKQTIYYKNRILVSPEPLGNFNSYLSEVGMDYASVGYINNRRMFFAVKFQENKEEPIASVIYSQLLPPGYSVNDIISYRGSLYPLERYNISTIDYPTIPNTNFILPYVFDFTKIEGTPNFTEEGDYVLEQVTDEIYKYNNYKLRTNIQDNAPIDPNLWLQQIETDFVLNSIELEYPLYESGHVTDFADAIVGKPDVIYIFGETKETLEDSIEFTDTYEADSPTFSPEVGPYYPDPCGMGQEPLFHGNMRLYAGAAGQIVQINPDTRTQDASTCFRDFPNSTNTQTVFLGPNAYSQIYNYEYENLDFKVPSNADEITGSTGSLKIFSNPKMEIYLEGQQSVARDVDCHTTVEKRGAYIASRSYYNTVYKPDPDGERLGRDTGGMTIPQLRNIVDYRNHTWRKEDTESTWLDFRTKFGRLPAYRVEKNNVLDRITGENRESEVIKRCKLFIDRRNPDIYLYEEIIDKTYNDLHYIEDYPNTEDIEEQLGSMETDTIILEDYYDTDKDTSALVPFDGWEVWTLPYEPIGNGYRWFTTKKVYPIRIVNYYAVYRPINFDEDENSYWEEDAEKTRLYSKVFYSEVDKSIDNVTIKEVQHDPKTGWTKEIVDADPFSYTVENDGLYFAYPDQFYSWFSYNYNIQDHQERVHFILPEEQLLEFVDFTSTHTSDFFNNVLFSIKYDLSKRLNNKFSTGTDLLYPRVEELIPREYVPPFEIIEITPSSTNWLANITLIDFMNNKIGQEIKQIEDQSPHYDERGVV